MHGPRLAWTIPYLLTALLLGSCSEKVSQPADHISAPESLRATVDDSLLFTGVFHGEPRLVARHLWDFNSDGIFDDEWVNVGGDGGVHEVLHAYARPDSYTATLQITTVDNRLFRATTAVVVTDELPVLGVTVADTLVVPGSIAGVLQCGEELALVGEAGDDAGRLAFWDADGDGLPDQLHEYDDAIAVPLTLSFDEPGDYPVAFGASDNDGNTVRLEFTVRVGHPPAWVPLQTTRLARARADHAAAAANGTIYVFGGRDGNAVLGSVESFDPAARLWRPAAPLPTPRWGCEAIVVRDSVYVVGGTLADGTEFRSLEIYDPATDAWRTLAGAPQHFMATSKRGFSLLEVGFQYAGGDSLMIFGGWRAGAVSDTTAIYNLRTETFSLDLTNFMRVPRAWMAAVTAWQPGDDLRGEMLAFGGTVNGSAPRATVESYSPATDFWHSQVAMPTPRLSPTAVQFGRKVYVIGGATGAAGVSDAVEIFYLDEERWETGPPLDVARTDLAAVVLDDRIYVIGGATEASSPYYVEGSRDVQVLVPWRCAP